MDIKQIIQEDRYLIPYHYLDIYSDEWQMSKWVLCLLTCHRLRLYLCSKYKGYMQLLSAIKFVISLQTGLN